MTSNTWAMTFSQPVSIGHAGRYPYIGQSPYYKGGYFFEGASYNNGNVIRTDGKTTEYGKGIARWGNGKQSLYCQYAGHNQAKKEGLWFGGSNNYLLKDDSWREIFKIESDEGLALYPLYYRYNYNYDLDVIGCRKDGIWIKYIDMQSIVKKYFGDKQSYNVTIGKHKAGDSHLNPHIRCENSTVIVPYFVCLFDPVRIVEEGEFRFK